MQEFELIAKTFMGLEQVLAKELTQLGANNVQIGRRMVSFTGDKEMMYRANFQLHTAIRVLKPIAHFKARSAEDMYEDVKKIDWSKYILKGKTFSVDSVVYSEEFTNSRFVTYKVKDAIVDQFRENTGERPNISVSNPDIRLNIHVAEDNATLSLDSSGESLHRRGYRQESVEAPVNEVLAAGMILMTGWKGETDFIDHIYGYDTDMKAVNTARMNVAAAGFSRYVTIEQQDFKDFTQPKEKSIIIMNPPYGERISTPNLLGTYKMIGERLKHEFMGNEAWILSYREECFRQIGLKPSIKIPVYNGSLECEFRRYQLFDGKMKEFRQEGGIIKTEEEKKEMAQKHRFKKERDFKKRLDENEENAEADIRSFTFHSLERNRLSGSKFRDDRGGRKPRFDRNDDRHDDRRNGKWDKEGRDNRRSFSRDDDRKFGGKRFDKANKRGGFRNKNIYHDED